MGVQAYHFGKNDFELGVGVKARTPPNILRVVLGPYVQYCPCEASEQKLGQKPKSELKEIELSYGQIMSKPPKWHLAYFVPIDGHFWQIGRYELQICLARSYFNFDIQTNFEVNQT